ncbi:hypothetical protein OHA72_35010 [Dactylosporangium sp. NBC_01737]|uniref:hypothetical protein n=1 Tax=Dactylosporangium sp. NBC_01737 TaxID=2975959 RepID=UPI002E14C564|nr:hypothetical protein OHA72_35010 [Dactylosporangium sp. NBC_01737]
MVFDVRAAPAEKLHRRQVNAWRRARFAQFPFRPGQRLPPAARTPTGVVKDHLQLFFTTRADADRERQEALQRQRGTGAYSGSVVDHWAPSSGHIPAYHRPQLTPPKDRCYECDGTGWLLHVTGAASSQQTLAERACELCGGTGSWRQAELRSGLPEHAFHRVPPNLGRTAPTPAQPGPASAPSGRGVPGIVRVVVGYPAFLVLAYAAAQPVYFVTRSSGAASLLALVAAAAVTPVLTRVVFGPLRPGQVLGPLWILVLPIYALFGFVFVCTALTGLDKRGALGANVLVLAASARHALSELPLGWFRS